MADFKTHVTTSSLLGIAYGTAAYHLGDYTPVQATLAGILTGVGGMLPDVDSQSGRPVREIFGLFAALAPVVLMERLVQWAGDAEGGMLLGVLIYVAIRYGGAILLSLLTVHRGMYHSIPALLISAELTYLAYGHPSVNVRLLMAGGVGLGFLSHLLLDEIYSVTWNGLAPKLKASAGSAMKLFSQSWPATFFAYSLLFVFSYGVLDSVSKDPGYRRTSTPGPIAKTATNQAGSPAPVTNRLPPFPSRWRQARHSNEPIIDVFR